MDKEFIPPPPNDDHEFDDNSGNNKDDKKESPKRKYDGLTGYSLAEIIGKGAGKFVFEKAHDRKQAEKWMAEVKGEIDSGNSPTKDDGKMSLGKIVLRKMRKFAKTCISLFRQMIGNQNIKVYYL